MKPPAAPHLTAVPEPHGDRGDNAAALDRFGGLLREAAAHGRLVQLLLVAYQGGVDDIEGLGQQLQRVIARPVMLRGQPHLSLVLRFPTKDITKNVPFDEAWPLLGHWLGGGGVPEHPPLHADP